MIVYRVVEIVLAVIGQITVEFCAGKSQLESDKTLVFKFHRRD